MIFITTLILLILGFSIYLDLRYFHNPFSLFIWNLFSIFSTFIIPIFYLEIRPYAEMMPYRIWDNTNAIVPMSILMVQVMSFVFFYFKSIGSYIDNLDRTIEAQNSISLIYLRPSSQIFIWLGVLIYLGSFVDLFLHWIDEPSVGGLYYRMKGHGWANFLLSSIILYLVIPLASLQGRIKKISMCLFLLHFIFLGLLMSRLTQIIKFVVVILIILINPFERKISLRFLSKIGVSCILGLFIFRGVEFVSTFGMQSQLNNFIPFLLEQNAGLTQELIANFYYAPAGFELNPLFFLRHFPIPFESSILGQLNALHNGGVEEWIYGIKKSSMGGLPFLPLAQNYFIGGIPLTILSAAISGIVLGKMNGYMNNWAKVKKNKKQIDLDMTLGFYALIWYIYPGFSFPGPIPILGFASSLFILGKLKKVES